MDLNTEYIWLGIGFALIIAEVTMGISFCFSRPCSGPYRTCAGWVYLQETVSLYPVCRTRIGVTRRRAFSPEAAFGWGLGAG